MTGQDLHDLLEHASEDVPQPHLAAAAWTTGRRRRTRRRVGWVATGAAAAVAASVLVTVVGDDSISRPEPAPATADTPSPSPSPETENAVGPSSVRKASPITAGMVQPFWDPRDTDSLPRLDAGLPTYLDGTAPTPLSQDPVDRALAATEDPEATSPSVLVLGDDDRWRVVDVPGLQPMSEGPGYGSFTLGRGGLSADGTQLVLIQPGGILVVDLTTGESARHTVAGGWGYGGAAWLPDGRHVLVGAWPTADSVVVDTETGETSRPAYLPNQNSEVAFAPDGTAVQEYWSGGRRELRWYTGSDLVDRLSDVDRIGYLNSPSASENHIGVVRGTFGWAGERDPQEYDGLAVLTSTGEPVALLPIRDPDSFYAGSMTMLGWWDEETLLVEYAEKPTYRRGQTASDTPSHLVAWNFVSGEVSLVADVPPGHTVALAPGLLG